MIAATGTTRKYPVDEAELGEYAQVVDEFSIHDGLIVASHRPQGTDGIVTTDGVITAADYETIWE